MPHGLRTHLTHGRKILPPFLLHALYLTYAVVLTVLLLALLFGSVRVLH
jgi:hypothetical protein